MIRPRRRPTVGAPGDREVAEMCANARRLAEYCERLGFGAEPLSNDSSSSSAEESWTHVHHEAPDGAFILPE